MNEPARRLAAAALLKVAIFAAPRLKSEWRRLLEDAWQLVVEASNADVVLADAESEVAPGTPVLRIGSGAGDAQGRLPQHATPDQIDAALRAVASGLLVTSQDSQEKGFRGARDVSEKALLTPRELDVLNALAEGLTNKAIARRLDISLHTVKFHVESVFRKLGVRNRSEATAKALERIREDRITI